MKRFAHGLIILGALVATTHAQQPRKAAEAERQAIADKDAAMSQGIIAVLAAENCFTSGSGQTFLKVCITENGNISWLESPAGWVHLKAREGYAVCTYDTSMTVHGFDVNMAAEGWGPSTVSDNKRIITRTSLDGMIQLKQTFTIVPAARGVDVKMELKNLSPVTLQGLQVTRYFDGDIDGETTNEYSHTGDSVWGKSSRGLMLAPSQVANANFYPITVPYGDWNPFGASWQFARGCQANLAPSGVTGDYVGGVSTQFGPLKSGQTKSLTFYYRRF